MNHTRSDDLKQGTHRNTEREGREPTGETEELGTGGSSYPALLLVLTCGAHNGRLQDCLNISMVASLQVIKRQ